MATSTGDCGAADRRSAGRRLRRRHGRRRAGADRSEQATFELVTVVSGLEHPWGMAFLPDGGILITERRGRLRSCATACSIRADRRRAGGLRERPGRPARRRARSRVRHQPAGSICPMPGRGRTARDSTGRARAARRRPARGPRGDLPRRAAGPLSKHFGSRLAFDPRRATCSSPSGERGQGERAQDLAEHNGSVMRLHRRRQRAGRTTRSSARPAPGPRSSAMATATRRAWRSTPRPARSGCRSTAPRGGDEVNVVRAGRQLRLAGDHLRHRLLRRADRRGHPQGGHGAAGPLLGALDRALGHGLLRGRRVPRVAGRSVRRRARGPAARAPRARRRAGGRARSACSRARSAASATSRSAPTVSSTC